MPPGTNEEIVLGQRAKLLRPRFTSHDGFSLVEMVVSIAVLLILAAVAMPSLTRAFASYQLNDAAARLAGIIKFTRYEAIRLNKPVDCQIQQTGAGWLVYGDTNRNHLPDPGETQDAITGQNTLLPLGGAIPSPGPIVTALGSPGLVLVTLSGSNAVLTFDSRGAVITGSVSNVYVLYLGSVSGADAGYRAVLLLPSGVVQVWTAPAGGVWQQVS
jgi:prepilin-type N-terminal cleavage/methylation domain-containing protein